MEIVDFIPASITRKTLPFEPIKLCPIGDIQAGIEECDLDLLQKKIKRAMEQDSYFIGMGDYLDVASPSNRAAWAGARVYDSMRDTMDNKMKEEEELLLEILAPTKNRWLGMLTGHHYWQYQDGTTTDTNLCHELGAVHLGTCGIVRVKFEDKNGHTVECLIYAHHGVGSGSSVGAPLTKLEKVMVWAEADLYLMGHQHKLVSASQPRFYLTEGKDPILVARNKRLVGTGSYLKGYMQGSKKGGIAAGGYVEQAMMTPVALGSPLITITPQRIQKQGKEIRDLEIEVLV